jgi:hypothetical protein
VSPLLRKSLHRAFLLHRRRDKSHLSLTQPLWLVEYRPTATRNPPLADRNLWQADILYHRPHNRQATGFRREGIYRISAPTHIAKQTFNGVGAADVAMHHLGEGVKGQEMLFIFAQAAHRFGIALLVFGFEGGQIEHGIFFLLLFEDARQFGGDLLLLPFGNGIHHIALFVDQATLTRRRRKER